MKRFDQFINENSSERALKVFAEHLSKEVGYGIDYGVDPDVILFYGKFDNLDLKEDEIDEAVKKAQYFLDVLKHFKDITEKYNMMLIVSKGASIMADFQFEMKKAIFEDLMKSNTFKSLKGIDKYDL